MSSTSFAGAEAGRGVRESVRGAAGPGGRSAAEQPGAHSALAKPAGSALANLPWGFQSPSPMGLH